MQTRPVGLGDQELIDALVGAWDLTVNRLRYTPRGFGSYHWLAKGSGGERYFVTVDNLDSKPWLGANRHSALASPERDLWMLDDGSPDSFAPYSQATDRAVDDTAVTLYRLSWTLADIAAFVALFRSEHQRNEDTEKAWRAFTGTLKQVSDDANSQD